MIKKSKVVLKEELKEEPKEEPRELTWATLKQRARLPLR